MNTQAIPTAHPVVDASFAKAALFVKLHFSTESTLFVCPSWEVIVDAAITLSQGITGTEKPTVVHTSAESDRLAALFVEEMTGSQIAGHWLAALMSFSWDSEKGRPLKDFYVHCMIA
ncbi:unnamed protein product [Strongylus vulgaris]|uniref:Uncharacterized protein n=1 Tax=Strongylus vulgaris TaxID=40348 RepID=A0A3P7INT0_STRVU|nr:unnamed protein product [Strongylus vulgaris]